MRRDVLFYRGMGPSVELHMPPPMPPHVGPPPMPDVRFFVHRGEAEYTDDLQALLGPDSVGFQIMLSVLRGGQLHDVQVTVAPRPAP